MAQHVGVIALEERVEGRAEDRGVVAALNGHHGGQEGNFVRADARLAIRAVDAPQQARVAPGVLAEALDHRERQGVGVAIVGHREAGAREVAQGVGDVVGAAAGDHREHAGALEHHGLGVVVADVGGDGNLAAGHEVAHAHQAHVAAAVGGRARLDHLVGLEEEQIQSAARHGRGGKRHGLARHVDLHAVGDRHAAAERQGVGSACGHERDGGREAAGARVLVERDVGARLGVGLRNFGRDREDHVLQAGRGRRDVAVGHEHVVAGGLVHTGVRDALVRVQGDIEAPQVGGGAGVRERPGVGLLGLDDLVGVDAARVVAHDHLDGREGEHVGQAHDVRAAREHHGEVIARARAQLALEHLGEHAHIDQGRVEADVAEVHAGVVEVVGADGVGSHQDAAFLAIVKRQRQARHGGRTRWPGDLGEGDHRGRGGGRDDDVVGDALVEADEGEARARSYLELVAGRVEIRESDDLVVEHRHAEAHHDLATRLPEAHVHAGGRAQDRGTHQDARADGIEANETAAEDAKGIRFHARAPR